MGEAQIQNWTERFLMNAGYYTRGMDAYGRGRFGDALRHWDRALQEARRKSFIRTERGRLFAHVGNHDGALSELTQALTEMRAEDERELIYVYESKALLEHSIAMLHERKGDLAAAREAYGRALQEDLSFGPAHQRLAILALAEGDTASALGSLDLAVQVNEGDVATRFIYAGVLAVTQRLDESAEQLQAAIDAAPHYAAPHFLLGTVRDWQGDLPGALEAYEGFVARASLGDSRRPGIQQRVAEIRAGPLPETAAAAPEDR